MADYGLLVAGAAIGLVSSGFTALIADALGRNARREERRERAEAEFLRRSRDEVDRLVELVEDDWRKVVRGEERLVADAQVYARLRRRALAALPTGAPVRAALDELDSIMQGISKVKSAWENDEFSQPEVEAELSQLNKRMQAAASDVYRGLADLHW